MSLFYIGLALILRRSGVLVNAQPGRISIRAPGGLHVSAGTVRLPLRGGILISKWLWQRNLSGLFATVAGSLYGCKWTCKP